MSLSLRRSLIASALLLAVLATTRPLSAQAQPAPNVFKAGARVEANYLGNTWIPATVVEVENDGYDYKLSGYPYGGAKPSIFILNYKRVRAAGAGPVQAPAPAPAAAGPVAPIAGKYGCTQSIWHPSGYEIEQRGFITLGANGSYHYAMGTAGRWRYDATKGVTTFTGGYMDGATATSVDGRRDRIFLVPWTRSERKGRWTCTKVG